MSKNRQYRSGYIRQHKLYQRPVKQRGKCISCGDPTSRVYDKLCPSCMSVDSAYYEFRPKTVESDDSRTFENKTRTLEVYGHGGNGRNFDSGDDPVQRNPANRVQRRVETDRPPAQQQEVISNNSSSSENTNSLGG